MKLAPCLAAAVLLALAAAPTASAEKLRSFDVRWDARVTYQETGDGHDHHLSFDAEGKLEEFVLGEQDNIWKAGVEAGDPVVTNLEGRQFDCCYPDGQVIRDCDVVDYSLLGRARLHSTGTRGRDTVFFTPGEGFIGDIDCGSEHFLLTKRYDGYQAILRAPVVLPAYDDGQVVRRFSASAHNAECPTEHPVTEFDCKATMKGTVTFTFVKEVDDSVKTKKPPRVNRVGPVQVPKPPKLDREKRTLIINGITSTKPTTVRFWIFGEPRGKGGKPRAVAAQSDQPLAQFVQVLMPGDPVDVEIPIDGPAWEQLREAGGLRLQIDALPGGGKAVRENLYLDVP